MRPVAGYVLAAVVGALAGLLCIGAVAVAGLYYANLAFDYDAKDGPVASAIVAGGLAAPVVGAAAAIWRTRSRRRTRVSDRDG